MNRIHETKTSVSTAPAATALPNYLRVLPDWKIAMFDQHGLGQFLRAGYFTTVALWKADRLAGWLQEAQGLVLRYRKAFEVFGLTTAGSQDKKITNEVNGHIFGAVRVAQFERLAAIYQALPLNASERAVFNADFINAAGPQPVLTAILRHLQDQKRLLEAIGAVDDAVIPLRQKAIFKESENNVSRARLLLSTDPVSWVTYTKDHMITVERARAARIGIPIDRASYFHGPAELYQAGAKEFGARGYGYIYEAGLGGTTMLEKTVGEACDLMDQLKRLYELVGCTPVEIQNIITEAYRSRNVNKLALANLPRLIVLFERAQFSPQENARYRKVLASTQNSTDIAADLVSYFKSQAKWDAYLAKMEAPVAAAARIFEGKTVLAARALLAGDADGVRKIISGGTRKTDLPQIIVEKICDDPQSCDMFTRLQVALIAQGVRGAEALRLIHKLITERFTFKPETVRYLEAHAAVVTALRPAEIEPYRRAVFDALKSHAMENKGRLVVLLQEARDAGKLAEAYKQFSPLKQRVIAAVGENIFKLAEIMAMDDAVLGSRIETIRALEVEVDGRTFWPCRNMKAAYAIAGFQEAASVKRKTEILIKQMGATQMFFDRNPLFLNRSIAELQGEGRGRVGTALLRIAVDLLSEHRVKEARRHLRKARPVLEGIKGYYNQGVVDIMAAVSVHLKKVNKLTQAAKVDLAAVKIELMAAYKLCLVAQKQNALIEMEAAKPICADLRRMLSAVTVAELAEQPQVPEEQLRSWLAAIQPRYGLGSRERLAGTIAAQQAMDGLVSYRRAVLLLGVYESISKRITDPELLEKITVNHFDANATVYSSLEDEAAFDAVGAAVMQELLAAGIVKSDGVTEKGIVRSMRHRALTALLFAGAERAVYAHAYRNGLLGNAEELARVELSEVRLRALDDQIAFLRRFIAPGETEPHVHDFFAGRNPNRVKVAQALWGAVGDRVVAAEAERQADIGDDYEYYPNRPMFRAIWAKRTDLFMNMVKGMVDPKVKKGLTKLGYGINAMAKGGKEQGRIAVGHFQPNGFVSDLSSLPLHMFLEFERIRFAYAAFLAGCGALSTENPVFAMRAFQGVLNSMPINPSLKKLLQDQLDMGRLPDGGARRQALKRNLYHALYEQVAQADEQFSVAAAPVQQPLNSREVVEQMENLDDASVDDPETLRQLYEIWND